MKKILILVIFLTGLAWHSFGQKSETPITKQYYLEKSNRQKKTGFILLGAGAAILGGIIGISNFCLFGCTSSQYYAMSAGGGLIMAGGISMVASVPLLIGAGVNANKAAELSPHTQP